MEVEKYIMTYLTGKKEVNLRILGKYFVKNNINKAKLIINNKKGILKDIININENKIKIQLILNKNIANKSEMFKDCEHLLSINDNKEILDFTYNEYLDNFEDKEIDNLFDIDINNENDRSSFYDNIGDNQFFNSIEFNTIKDKRTNNSTILFFKNKFQNMKNIDTILNTNF